MGKFQREEEYYIGSVEQMSVIVGQNVSILKAGVVYLRGPDLARVVRSNRSLGPACKQSSRPRLLTCVLCGGGGEGASEMKQNKTNTQNQA